MTAIGISTFLDDPQLLGRDFAAPSWDTWKLVLRAALGECLSEMETAHFRDLAYRDPPKRRVRELWLAIGRRAGKDSIASAVATFLAVYGDFKKHLRRGERATVVCLAVDRTQARIVFDYIRSYFEEIPLLKFMLVSANNGVIELKNGVDIVVATNSFRAIRGRTIACVILDEIAYWRDENFANPDVEVYSALLPSLITLRESGAMLIGISTVYRRLGLLYEKFSAHHGKADDDVLYILAPSQVFNPRLAGPGEAAEIDRQRELDPERAAAEWDSQWRSDLSGFISREIVESIIDRGTFEREYDPSIRNYVAFTDESGGSGGDASTLAVAHAAADGTIIEDLVRTWKVPFVPSSVIAEKAGILKAWGLRHVTGDRWASGIPGDLYEQNGIRYEKSAKVTSDIYQDFLHLANSRRARLLDNKVQKAELLGLTRKVSFGGKEVIGHHAYNGHDDTINACAGACVLAATDPPRLVITDEMLRKAAMPAQRYGNYGRVPMLGRPWMSPRR